MQSAALTGLSMLQQRLREPAALTDAFPGPLVASLDMGA